MPPRTVASTATSHSSLQLATMVSSTSSEVIDLITDSEPDDTTDEEPTNESNYEATYEDIVLATCRIASDVLIRSVIEDFEAFELNVLRW